MNDRHLATMDHRQITGWTLTLQLPVWKGKLILKKSTMTQEHITPPVS